MDFGGNFFFRSTARDVCCAVATSVKYVLSVFHIDENRERSGGIVTSRYIFATTILCKHATEIYKKCVDDFMFRRLTFYHFILGTCDSFYAILT